MQPRRILACEAHLFSSGYINFFRPFQQMETPYLLYARGTTNSASLSGFCVIIHNRAVEDVLQNTIDVIRPRVNSWLFCTRKYPHTSSIVLFLFQFIFYLACNANWLRNPLWLEISPWLEGGIKSPIKLIGFASPLKNS